MLRLIKRPAPEWTDEAAARLRPYGGVLARLLHARGVETAAQADRFLHPDMDDLNDPLLLSDMDKALSLLHQAKAEGWPVVIYGDYDVDGVCATALLKDALDRAGIAADTHIPLRSEGYGLNLPAVEALAKRYRLLVTVDLGISNRAEVLRAQALGMRVIVTDHHQLALEECPADAVIDPLLAGYPFPRLCGTGVAFKLAQALLGTDRASDLMELAALATIADMVPLVEENRAITALGLAMMEKTRRIGLRALMEQSRLSGPVRSDQVAFQLAPRLNAAGRLNDAGLGLELLLTRDESRAKELAQQLDTANTERRALEGRMLDEALLQVQGADLTRQRILFVKGDDWHAGVIGLVAGRLCQRFACPVMALCRDGELLHGSLRSVAGVNIHRMLQACDDLLVRYGGHEMAAGATLRAQDEAAMRQRLNEAIAQSSDEGLFVPAQEYDIEAPFALLDRPLCEQLDRLAPFGLGNPAPLLLTRGLSLERRRACGAGGAHLQVTLRDGDALLDGIAFQMGDRARTLPDAVDAVYSLQENEYMGRVKLQCDIKSISPADGAMLAQLQGREPAAEAQALLSSLIWQQSGQIQTLPDVSEGKNELVPEWLLDTEGSATRAACDALIRGTLIVCRTRETAKALLRRLEGRVDVVTGAPSDPRCFPTLLLCPEEARVSGCWRYVLLVDGALTEQEATLWQARLPQARVIVRPASPALRRLCASIDAGDEGYRALYRVLRQSVVGSLSELAAAAALSPAQTRAGLWAFHQLRLADYAEAPFSCLLLPPTPCKLGDSHILSALRRIQKEVLPC